jgi:cardiolipin synthase
MAIMQIYAVLWWSGGVILAAVAVILLILNFPGTCRDRIEYKAKNVPSREATRFLLALASLSPSLLTVIPRIVGVLMILQRRSLL